MKVIGAVAHIGAAAIEWQRSMLDKVGTVLELCLDGTVRVEFASEGAAWFPVATRRHGRPVAVSAAAGAAGTPGRRAHQARPT